MASRTKQKEEARAARLAAEQQLVERDRRQRRLRMLLIAGAAAVALVVVAIVVSSNGGNTLKTGTQAKQTVGSVQQVLSGIPQSGTRLGNPRAPVTMIYYGDLQCPICGDFTRSDGFSQLLANDVRSGKLQIQYRNFETATQDPQVFHSQQVAALAAGKQNHFWDFAELFYRQQGTENSGYVTLTFLTGLAQQIPGLDLAKWRTDRTDPSLVSQVNEDVQQGQAARVPGTPTLIFKGPKGSIQLPDAVPTSAQLQQALTTVS